MQNFEEKYGSLVIGANGGIGAAMASALESDPTVAFCERVERARYPDFDLTNEESIAAIAKGFKKENRVFDLIFDATGALEIDGGAPEKTLRALDPENMAKHFAINAIGPSLLIKHFSPLLVKNRRAIFATLSARVGSIGDNQLGGWISYRASKAALNQIVKTASIELKRTRPEVICISVHPGTVRTKLSNKYNTSHKKFEPQEAAQRILETLTNLTPEKSGCQIAYDGTIVPN